MLRYDKSQVVFMDTETTGLYPWMGHEVWDIAHIQWEDGKWVSRQYFVPPQRLDLADPMSLRVNRFYERTRFENNKDFRWHDPRKVARLLSERLDGKHVIGAIPSFDVEFLRNFFMTYGFSPPTTHYHIMDIEMMCVGWIAAYSRMRDDPVLAADLPLPWKSEWLHEKIGIPKLADEVAHTALGDTAHVKAVWDYMVGYDE